MAHSPSPRCNKEILMRSDAALCAEYHRLAAIYTTKNGSIAMDCPKCREEHCLFANSSGNPQCWWCEYERDADCPRCFTRRSLVHSPYGYFQSNNRLSCPDCGWCQSDYFLLDVEVAAFDDPVEVNRDAPVESDIVPKSKRRRVLDIDRYLDHEWRESRRDIDQWLSQFCNALGLPDLADSAVGSLAKTYFQRYERSIAKRAIRENEEKAQEIAKMKAEARRQGKPEDSVRIPLKMYSKRATSIYKARDVAIVCFYWALVTEKRRSPSVQFKRLTDMVSCIDNKHSNLNTLAKYSASVCKVCRIEPLDRVVSIRWIVDSILLTIEQLSRFVPREFEMERVENQVLTTQEQLREELLALDEDRITTEIMIGDHFDHDATIVGLINEYRRPRYFLSTRDDLLIAAGVVYAALHDIKVDRKKLITKQYIQRVFDVSSQSLTSLCEGMQLSPLVSLK